MKRITLLDTSIGSTNKGDDIIMKCLEEEMSFLFQDYFLLRVPTHLCAFNILECLGNLPDSANEVYQSDYKFVCGTNLLSTNMFNRTNQWDINLFNVKPITGSILIAAGGSGNKPTRYTQKLYKKILSPSFVHSVRDQNGYKIVSSLGYKCINTGCVTMWKLTPEFCGRIPTQKANQVVFTLTDYNKKPQSDKALIDWLKRSYSRVYFWIQGIHDYEYLCSLTDLKDICVIAPDVKEYNKVLSSGDIDYVGTRLHAGIYAMRHGVRSIIITIDGRMGAMSERIPNNTIERDKLEFLDKMICSNINTVCSLDWNGINAWKQQFVSELR